jgi:O-antigen/teichoic acid export membrane protein
MPDRFVEIVEESVRGGFFLFTGNILSTFILAVGSIIVARLLGPESYGLYSLSLVVPSILVGLVDLGMDPALTRFIARLRAKGKSDLAAGMLRSGFLFKILIGVSMSAVCFFFSEQFATYILNRPEVVFLVRLTSPLILLQAIFTAANSAFIGLDRMESNALIMNVRSIVKVVSSCLLVAIGFGVAGSLTGQISGFLVASLIGISILLKHYRGLGDPSRSGFPGNLRVMLSYGLPLYFVNVLILFLGQYRTIILAFLASNTEIGNLNVAVTLSSAVNILVFPLSVLFPAFSKVNPDSSELKKLFTLSVKYTAVLIVPASVLIAAASKEIVHTFYGQMYDSAPFYLSLYILTFLYSGLGSMVFQYLFNGLGETKTIFKANILRAAFLIPLAPALTVLYGVPGLIGAILISSLPSLAYKLFTASRKFNLKIDFKSSMKTYLSSLLSAIPLMIFLQLSPLSSLLNLVFSCVIYIYTLLTIAPLTKTITREDLVNLRAILKTVSILNPVINPILKYEEMILKLVDG